VLPPPTPMTETLRGNYGVACMMV